MAFGITKYLDIADGKDAPYQNLRRKSSPLMNTLEAEAGNAQLLHQCEISKVVN